MNLRTILISLTAISLISCGGSSSTQSESQSSTGNSTSGGTTTPPPPTNPTQGNAMIDAAGGKVSLPGVAELDFPSGTFTSQTNVQLSQVPIEQMPEPYRSAARDYDVLAALPQAVVVRIGHDEPAKDIQVTINLPSDFLAKKRENFAFAILGGASNENETEGPYDVFDPIQAELDESKRTLSFKADSVFFSQLDQNNNALGQFVVVQLPGTQQLK